MQKKKQRQRRNDGKPYIKIIDWVFHNEQEIRQAIIDERNKAAGNPLVRNASKISKPTEVAAMQEMVPPPPLPVVILKEDDGELKYLEHPERWLVVIDRTYAWCKRQKGCHYEAAHRRYNGESYKTICMELYISTTSLSYILDDVRTYAALQAVQFHLIKVE
ncbi:MAG: hypothetical protein IJ563_05175 [Selenomonadaceae bacterium]|nr:hypothetical protein [Selenomonadaceae bacterium]